MNAQSVNTIRKKQLFMLSRDNLSQSIFYMSVLFLGLGFHAVYVLFLLFFLLLKPSYLIKPKIKSNFMVLFLLISFFLVPQYLIGYQQITVDNPVLSMLSVMFSIVIYGILLQQMPIKVIRASIVFLVIGIGIEALITLFYSYHLNPALYGYGLLYNPILNKEVNSPGVALKIACFSSMLVWFVFQYLSTFRKIGLLFIISILVIFSMWLASRAFFVILFLAIALSLLLNLKLKNIGNFIFLSLLGLGCFYLLLQHFDISLFSRVNRLDGSLQSPRFLLWQDGFLKLLTHPLGGFSVDQTIEPVRWFHNIFLDAGRLAGWIPIVSLALFTFYSFVLFLQRKNKYSLFAGFMFAVVFALAQQDVVVEAMIRFVVLLYFCAILLGVKDSSQHIKARTKQFSQGNHV